MRIHEQKILNDIPVFYIEAKSFPMGIKDAFDSLHEKLNGNKLRTFYGISSPQNNKGIIYKACAEQIENGEAEKLGLTSVVIPKGNYHCIEVTNFRANMMGVGKAFEEMLSQPNIDPKGFCLEIYGENPDLVKCLVRKQK